jgi:dihydroneopterin aldolase
LSRDQIRISGLTCDCIVGIFPEERVKAQPLVLDLALDVALGPAAKSGDLTKSVDYGRLAGDLTFILEAGKFRLLETAGLALCHYVLTGSLVTAVAVTIHKPAALGGRGVPAIMMSRAKEDVAIRTERVGAGRLDRIFVMAEVGVFRLEAWTDESAFAGYSARADRPLATGATLRVTST